MQAGTQATYAGTSKWGRGQPITAVMSHLKNGSGAIRPKPQRTPQASFQVVPFLPPEGLGNACPVCNLIQTISQTATAVGEKFDYVTLRYLKEQDLNLGISLPPIQEPPTPLCVNL